MKLKIKSCYKYDVNNDPVLARYTSFTTSCQVYFPVGNSQYILNLIKDNKGCIISLIRLLRKHWFIVSISN